MAAEMIQSYVLIFLFDHPGSLLISPLHQQAAWPKKMVFMVVDLYNYMTDYPPKI
jgi:hypothetical protein